MWWYCQVYSSDSYLYMYVLYIVFRFSSLIGYYRILRVILCATQQVLLVIYLILVCVCTTDVLSVSPNLSVLNVSYK